MGATYDSFLNIDSIYRENRKAKEGLYDFILRGLNVKTVQNRSAVLLQLKSALSAEKVDATSETLGTYEMLEDFLNKISQSLFILSSHTEKDYPKIYAAETLKDLYAELCDLENGDKTAVQTLSDDMAKALELPESFENSFGYAEYDDSGKLHIHNWSGNSYSEFKDKHQLFVQDLRDFAAMKMAMDTAASKTTLFTQATGTQSAAGKETADNIKILLQAAQMYTVGTNTIFILKKAKSGAKTQTATLSNGEHIRLRVDSAGTGTATFRLPNHRWSVKVVSL